jgi:hypothetical protein
MASKKRSSASGEVNVIRAHLKQYTYAACTIYLAMYENELQSIIVGCEEAGMFDDVVLLTADTLRATQVKTEIDPTYIKLKTELRSSKPDSDSLIAKMSASWKSLTTLAEGKKLHLRYIFQGIFSLNDSLANKSSPNSEKHSAAFARFISLTHFSKQTLEHSHWSDTLSELQSLSKLDSDDFVSFLNSLELFDRDAVQGLLPENFPREKQRIKQIENLLPQLVANAKAKSRWTEDELLEKLGWRSRANESKTHVFPVRENFQENEATRDELLAAIKNHDSGYIALLGPPGTGKSTLLQGSLLFTHEFSVSRYLAFVPDPRHGLGRAEGVHFLNDLIGQLKSVGFKASPYVANDLYALHREFTDLLDQAARRFQESKVKTVIVIDGLDHVLQERPSSSFLRELPIVQGVPKGVLFVLGSQYLEIPDLPFSIQQQAKSAGRCIKISNLSKSAIFKMAKAAALPSYIDYKKIYEACDGHPLTARYLITALKTTETECEANQILSHPVGQPVSQFYERVWREIGLGKNKDCKRAFGLLARADDDLDLKELAKVVEEEAIELILEKADFLLEKRGSRRSIFHHSFRLFLIDETGKQFSEPCEKTEATFHQTLAEGTSINGFFVRVELALTRGAHPF